MPSSSVRSVSNVEEFRSLIRPANTELLVTGKGRFAATVTKIELNHLWTQTLTESLPRSWQVALTGPRVGILFQGAPGATVTYGGKELASNDVGFVTTGLGLWHRVSGPSRLASFSLPDHVVVQRSVNLFGRDLTPKSGHSWAAVPPATMARLRRLHAAVTKLAADAPEIIANMSAATGIETSLTDIFLECLNSGSAGKDHPIRQLHSRILRRLHEIELERPGEPLNVADVCAALGVSGRVLHRICYEQLGIGPKQYLVLRRLHMAHRALLQARVGTSVTEIATRFGFWELGRFAVLYRTIFGESPSATLRNQGASRSRSAVPERWQARIAS